MDNIKKTELNHLQVDLADEMSHYSQFKALLVLAFIVTLISYLLFSGHLKLGNPLYWGEYFNKGYVTIAAFIFMLISVILLGVFLAWVKHFAYNHFTTYRAIAGVMITLVGFALLAEMFAALEDQKAKADIQLESNSAYQATIAPVGSGISTSPSLSADIAAASQKLARCKANLGKPGYKHCDGDKAKLDALEKQQHIDLICIEDLTHRMVKAALPLRLQGALRYVLRQTYPDVPIEMLLPSVWQSFLGYKRVQGLTTKDWSSFVVHALGYKFEGTKGKALTDLNDAALIARWGYEKYRKTDG